MNQKTKYIGMLAIIPLVMVAIVPNYIGEADASYQDFGAIETLKVLNAVQEQPTAELSLVQISEPKETNNLSVEELKRGSQSADNSATAYKVLYRVLNAVDSDVQNVEISVNSDTQTVSEELIGNLDSRHSIISVVIEADDPSSISAEIVDFDFRN